MKVRISKQSLSQMPEQVREIVEAWRSRYHKAYISVENRPSFIAAEDSRVTLINLQTGRSGTERVAGEFAGMTRLSPCAEIPLPVGVVAVEESFFCGVPFLTLHQGSVPQIG
jgi:hypothetical protein